MPRDNSERIDESKPPEYDPPRATVVGTVRELTQGAPAGFSEAAVFSIGVSDRRLKDRVRPVDGRTVLTMLAGL